MLRFLFYCVVLSSTIGATLADTTDIKQPSEKLINIAKQIAESRHAGAIMQEVTLNRALFVTIIKFQTHDKIEDLLLNSTASGNTIRIVSLAKEGEARGIWNGENSIYKIKSDTETVNFIFSSLSFIKLSLYDYFQTENKNVIPVGNDVPFPFRIMQAISQFAYKSDYWKAIYFKIKPSHVWSFYFRLPSQDDGCFPLGYHLFFSDTDTLITSKHDDHMCVSRF